MSQKDTNHQDDGDIASKVILILSLLFLLFAITIKLISVKNDDDKTKYLAELDVKDIKGRDFSSRIIEKDFVVYNFFASWCKPCIAEHKYIKRLSKERNLQIIGVAWRDKKNKIEAWIKQHGNPYHRIIYDKTGEIAVNFGIKGIPEIYIFAKNGERKYFHRGNVTSKILNYEILPLLNSSK